MDKIKKAKKQSSLFYKISDLPTGEYQIIIGNRANGIAHTQAMIMLKWLKSVLMVYEDKGKLVLGIRPEYDEKECIDVIRGWLDNDK